MKLIVGLGNPGPAYHRTRHNTGFFFIDLLAEKFQIDLNKNKFSSLFGEGIINNQKVILTKPQTFMNLSGIAVRDILHFYKLEASALIVIHDDMDISLGEFKKKLKGGDAGHKGIKSITECLGADEYMRLRIGIGRPEKTQDPADYVLNPFTSEELKIISTLLPSLTAEIK